MKLKDLCFEIIQKCPNNCKFCSSNSSIDKNEIIDYELFKKTIDHFIKLGGIEEISISGGEPFLHPDIVKMVDYCKKYNIRTVIYTSGITSRKKISDDVLSKLGQHQRRIMDMYSHESFDSLSKETLILLKKIGLDKIVFDFQSSCVEQYNYLMGTKNLISYVLKSMAYAQSALLDAEIHFIPLRHNYRQVVDVLEIAELAGIKMVSILKFVPQGRGLENYQDLVLNFDELKDFFDILNTQKIYHGEIRKGIPFKEQDEHLCTAGYDKLVIKYNGDVLPCPAFKEIDLNVLSEYGINIPNIRNDLNKVMINAGSREKPLCKMLNNRRV